MRERIARAAESAGRDPSEVLLVAVSKTMPLETILEAYNLGQRDFGENKVQELTGKLAALPAMGVALDARWHLVGHLQSNKARPAAALFDIIQSVDSLRLALLLNRQSEELGRKLPVLLQVDFTREPQRSGFHPSELDAEASQILALHALEVQGLMTIAPFGVVEAETRSVFRQLREQRDRLAARHSQVAWHHLSMGMTDDFEIAIEEGSTMVRVGRALFGERARP